MDLLLRLREVFAGHRRVWVTTPGPKAAQLHEEGERVLLVPPLDRRRPDIRNPLRSLRLVLRERPRLVVTSGAGVVATFAAGARALGARLVFVETMARVTSSSATARILAPIADDVFVQWPERLGLTRGATLARPMLLSEIASESAVGGEGTFLTVGSHNQPFDRLLRATAAAAADGLLPAPVRAQVGPSTFEAAALDRAEWMEPEEIEAGVRAARYVVCHGGAGAMTGALRAGRRPLVMSRRRDLGEHVDDHQGDLVATLDRMGLVVRIEHGIAAQDIAAADRPWPDEAPWTAWPDLRESLAAVLRRESR